MSDPTKNSRLKLNEAACYGYRDTFLDAIPLYTLTSITQTKSFLFSFQNLRLMLLPSAQPFLDHLFTRLAADQIDVQRFKLDHICYRVETEERYLALKEALKKEGTLLAESQIGGRPISTFILHEPIRFRERAIPCLELPAPKPGKAYAEGYEHVEFVIDEPFAAFMARYPHVTFDTKGMQKAVNADIRIQYPDGSVKFHHHSLEYVIRYLE
jgi:predicted metalloenzyme YecM